MKQLIFSALVISCLLQTPVQVAHAQEVTDEPEVSERAPLERFRSRRGPGGEGRRAERIGKMGKFLRFMREFYGSVSEPHGAASVAAVSIREHYARKGTPEEAIPVLEKHLAATKEQKMRNVLLFTIRQIHEKAGNTDKLFELDQQILTENVDAVN